MARKKDVYRVKPMTDGKRNIITSLLSKYNIKSAEYIQNCMKRVI